jgi:hypothetical protein
MIYLFIDGELAHSSPLLEIHQPQALKPMLLGRYNEKEDIYPFYGNISHFTVVHFDENTRKSVEEISAVINKLKGVQNSRDVSELFALFPLSDAVHEVPNSIANELINANNGIYTFAAVKRRF